MTWYLVNCCAYFICVEEEILSIWTYIVSILICCWQCCIGLIYPCLLTIYLILDWEFRQESYDTPLFSGLFTLYFLLISALWKWFLCTWISWLLYLLYESWLLVCQEKVPRTLLDVNILLSKEQTVHKEEDFRWESGMNFRGLLLQDGLQNENEQLI